MPVLSQLIRIASNVAKLKQLLVLVSRFQKHGKQYKTLSTSSCNSIIIPQRGLQVSSKAHGISPLSDPENKGQRQSGVNFDVLGSWNNRLELNVNVQQSIKRGSLIPQITLENAGSATLLGRRKYNEDRALLCEVKPGLLMFGVFDGHGGNTAAQYTQDHLIDHVTFWIERGERNMEKVLKNAFIDLNNIFTRSLYQKQIGMLNVIS